MMRRRVAFSALLVAALSAAYMSVQRPAVAGSLPERLTGDAFWHLSQQLSEPDGFFRSDNLVSNEIWMQHVIPDLLERVPPGTVYLGVGPEQNFTYIAAAKPAMAFIIDVRRGNLHLHLLYKALFDLSADRADFLSRLFARARPEGLTTDATVEALFAAYATVPASEPLYRRNLRDIREHLLETRGLPLEEADLAGIEYVAHEFYTYGPGVHYRTTRGTGPWGRRMPDYTDMMLTTDQHGQNRAYLASEESFQFLRQLHARNLIVPVVGNFGGPKAVRAVGRFVRDAGATVGVFYLSNVEQYLHQQGLTGAFCANVASLPLEPRSSFIRSVRGQHPDWNYPRYRAPGLINRLGSMQAETAHCR